VQFIVKTSDELPLYRQIIRQVIEAIAGGKLKSGDRLQSHRDLSEQLVIAPLTVKRAYDELESLGYIETQRGRGTFIRASLPQVNGTQQREALEKTARKLLSDAYLAGLNFPDVVELLESTDRELRSKEQE
jgi:GntR family transcriptional regulator